MLALQALVVLATAFSVAAAPGLTLKVEGASSVTDVDNFKVSTILTNTGDETLKILNDPLGPLSNLPTDSFSVVNSQGSSASFAGAKAKYVPAVAAEVGDYTTLAPGQSITVNHDLSEAYNLTATGAGTYDVEPRNVFYLVNEKNEISSIHARVSKVHKARVSGRLSKVRPTPTLAKRATYVSCTAARQTILVEAAAAAQAYATEAKSFLDANSATTTRYSTWFGAFTTARYNTVLSHFTAINSNVFSSFTYDCSCTRSGTYAYVYPAEFGRIYLCPVFWNVNVTGTDSRGGTLIHESSHFDANAGGTDDIVYGQTGAKNLAISNPNNAVINADSHEYFAENNPFQS
ncbi:hypothetical protein D9611_007165 [Ephemerocybe angulata]|uniref:Lysine-specific metallo-endopeptidase domain-containing protein n=1 Tax=Ephemerocybe angulata TaxID=980116 RepID=A0A8H5B2P5_9AGAR|nr:hypothetical protein D9611_007165 [Tulosesus angulatus]